MTREQRVLKLAQAINQLWAQSGLDRRGVDAANDIAFSLRNQVQESEGDSGGKALADDKGQEEKAEEVSNQPTARSDGGRRPS